MKLIKGNCVEELPKIIEELKRNEKSYIIVSDPPFNINYHYNNYNDSMSEEEYFDLLKFIFESESSVIIHYPEVLHKISYVIGDFPTKIVSWVYNSNTAKQHRDIAFYNIKPDFKKVGQPYKNPNDKRIKERIKQGKIARLYDWWEINQIKNVSKNKDGFNHPCIMPLEVMKRIIGILPNDVVIIDPFMGSGTTGLACKELNKYFIGIELDDKYFEIAKKRLS
jgi:DNA modification methylase